MRREREESAIVPCICERPRGIRQCVVTLFHRDLMRALSLLRSAKSTSRLAFACTTCYYLIRARGSRVHTAQRSATGPKVCPMIRSVRV